MANITEYSRLLFKRSSAPGVIPTITTATTIDSSWLPTDILVGEGFVNIADDRFWIRTNNGLVEFDLSGQTANRLTTGATLIGNTIYFETPESPSAYTVDLSSIIVTGGTGGFSGYTYIQEDVSLQSLALSGASLLEIDVRDIDYINYNYRVPNQEYTRIENFSGNVSTGSQSVFSINNNVTSTPLDSIVDLNLLELEVYTQVYTSGNTLINTKTAIKDETTITAADNIFYENKEPNLYERTVSETLGFTTGTSIIQDSNNIIIEGSGYFGGIKYDSDYSIYYTNRSLVDKGYVDTISSGFSTFTGYTYIQEDVSLQSLALSGAASLIFDIQDFTNKNTTERSSSLLNSQIEDKLNGDTTNIIQGFLEAGAGINLNAANTGGTYGNIAVTNSVIETRVTDGTDTSLILVQPNDIWIEGTGTFEGAKYDGDYSANFVNRSLVDKEYVDNVISGFSTFTGYTYIQEDTIAETLALSGAYNTIINTSDVSYINNIDVQPPFTDSKVTNLDNNNTAQIYNGYGDDGIVVNQIVKTNSDNSVTKSSVADEVITLGVNVIDIDVDTRVYLDRDMVEERVRDNTNGNIASVRLTATEKYQSIADNAGNSTIKTAGPSSIQNQLFSDTEDRTIFHNIDNISISNLIYQPSDANVYYSEITNIFKNETIITNNDYTIVQTTDASVPIHQVRLTQPNIDDSSSIKQQYINYIYEEVTDGVNIASSQTTVENILHSVISGEGQTDFIQINNDGVKLAEVIGSSYTNFIVNNADGFYKSQFQSTGVSKGVSKERFVSTETTDDTITSVIYPLSDLEIETGAIGIKATVTALNTDEDKAYVSELYAAVRINSYTPTIFGGVDKLEKTEFTTATATIEIESSNVAIRVTGEAATTIVWSVKYELIYSVPQV